MTEVGRLFQMAGTAELKARPPYATVRSFLSYSRNTAHEMAEIDKLRFKG